MSSEFTSVAKSRARYYCKGAPVQFVQVELLRMEENDSMVVTLTFKNIAPQVLTSFTAHFRCKNTQGEVILEDNFTYVDLEVGEGGLFGGDDAVCVSDVPLSSVEVNLVNVDYNGVSHALTRCPPVPLPVLKPLSAQAVALVNNMLQIDSAHYIPANVTDGWQCTCGAFNYNIGTGKSMCSECGADKASLLNAVREALQPTRPRNIPAAEEPYLPVMNSVPASAGMGDTAQYARLTDMDTFGVNNAYADPYDADAKTAVIPAQRGGDAGVMLMKTQTADFILKFAPYITLGASTVYVLIMMLLNMLLN